MVLIDHGVIKGHSPGVHSLVAIVSLSLLSRNQTRISGRSIVHCSGHYAGSVRMVKPFQTNSWFNSGSRSSYARWEPVGFRFCLPLQTKTVRDGKYHLRKFVYVHPMCGNQIARWTHWFVNVRSATSPNFTLWEYLLLLHLVTCHSLDVAPWKHNG